MEFSANDIVVLLFSDRKQKKKPLKSTSHMVKHEPYFFYVQIFGFVELKSPKRPVDEKSSVQGSVDGGWGGGVL